MFNKTGDEEGFQVLCRLNIITEQKFRVKFCIYYQKLIQKLLHVNSSSIYLSSFWFPFLEQKVRVVWRN